MIFTILVLLQPISTNCPFLPSSAIFPNFRYFAQLIRSEQFASLVSWSNFPQFPIRIESQTSIDCPKSIISILQQYFTSVSDYQELLDALLPHMPGQFQVTDALREARRHADSH